jgi:hypothetical protein
VSFFRDLIDGAVAFVVLGLATLGIDVLSRGEQHDDEQDGDEDDYGLSVGAW